MLWPSISTSKSKSFPIQNQTYSPNQSRPAKWIEKRRRSHSQTALGLAQNQIKSTQNRRQISQCYTQITISVSVKLYFCS